MRGKECKGCYNLSKLLNQKGKTQRRYSLSPAL